MTPAARLVAAASILDSITQGRAPADVVIKAWGGANRYAGSKDRRAIAERVYLVLRSRDSAVLDEARDAVVAMARQLTAEGKARGWR